MIRFEPWLLDVMNRVSMEKLGFELIQNPLERPELQVKTRGLLLGDVATGGVVLDELVATMTFPSGQPVLPKVDMGTLQSSSFRVDHMLVKISQDWINKALAKVPQLASKGLAVQLSLSDAEPSKVTFAGSFKRHVSFSLDFHLGIQGNLLHILIDEIRVLKFLPLFSLPGLKGLILNTIKENLPTNAVRMNQDEIFVDVASQLPLPVNLRWRRFQSEGPFIVVEAGT